VTRADTTLSHRDAFDLLPWYSNGTLAEPERNDVRAHLGTCLVCRRELAFLEQLERGVAGSADLDFTPQRSLGALLPRIAACEAPPARRAWLRVNSAIEALRALHPALRGTLLVQTALILFAGLFLLRAPLPDRAPRFETLSDAPALAAADPGALRLRVVFAPAATAADIETLLRASDARMVDGPSSVGAFAIAVPAEAGADVLERLRADARVRLAEPVGEAP
jgi:hypothetical protein